MLVLDSRGWCIVCNRVPETSLGRRRSQCPLAFGRPGYWAFPVFLFRRNYSPALPRIPRVSPETVILKEHEIEQVLFFFPNFGETGKSRMIHVSMENIFKTSIRWCFGDGQTSSTVDLSTFRTGPIKSLEPTSRKQQLASYWLFPPLCHCCP